MAADAALTESYRDYQRVLIGASKLLPHFASASCLGTFGAALLPNPVPDSFPIGLEFVLKEFLDIARTIENGQELSGKLVEWLNDNFRTAKGVIGIDVASVRATSSHAESVVYRVMNADAVDESPGRFRRFAIRSPGGFNELDDSAILVAGDINADVWVDELRGAVRNAAFRTKRSVPESADEVASWLAVLVRTVSDLYSNMGVAQTIAGPVSTVSLLSRGPEVKLR